MEKLFTVLFRCRQQDREQYQAILEELQVVDFESLYPTAGAQEGHAPSLIVVVSTASYWDQCPQLEAARGLRDRFPYGIPILFLRGRYCTRDSGITDLPRDTWVTLQNTDNIIEILVRLSIRFRLSVDDCAKAFREYIEDFRTKRELPCNCE